MLRDHEIFQKPLPIEVGNTIPKPRPEAWRYETEKPILRVLPLVTDTTKTYRSGWCTYTYYFPDTPDLEVMSGGINTKTIEAGGLWRQGHLMHFGFDLSPTEMNENGRALLINSIVYIAKFSDDRPIPTVPSVFAGIATRHRKFIDRTLSRQDLNGQTIPYLKTLVAEETLGAARTENVDKLKAYFAKVGEYLYARTDGKLIIDKDAQKLGISPRSPQFLTKTVAELSESRRRSDAARRMLDRYRPHEAPPATAPKRDWKSWLNENKNYLFFCDGGWYRWYLDPLAKKRGIPTAELRGPKRATPSH